LLVMLTEPMDEKGPVEDEDFSTLNKYQPVEYGAYAVKVSFAILLVGVVLTPVNCVTLTVCE
jgi:hypothetical protein